MSLSKKAPGIKYGNKVPAVEHTYEHIIPQQSHRAREIKRGALQCHLAGIILVQLINREGQQSGK